MLLSIRYIALVVFSFFLIAGCTGRKDEGTQNTVQSEISTSDPTGESSLQVEDSEPPLVTFIELGSVKCVPCKMMQPIIAEIEKEYLNQVKVIFYDVWTDEGKPYAVQFGIRAIPTQVFLDQNGVEYFRHTGFFPKDEIVKVLLQKGVQ
ncbi:thioredoxin family protein [candidate division KSB1 bacterium]|nr:thioredoxin family protein [candidate division KSB1 bacterium]